MKPNITWVLVANASTAQIVANHGPGKGFVAVSDRTWTAEPGLPHADRQGVSHSSRGASLHRMAPPHSTETAEADFAKMITATLSKDCRDAAFDQLVVTAGPRMLGALRQAITGQLRDKVMAERAKDLTHIAIEDLPAHLADVIAA